MITPTCGHQQTDFDTVTTIAVKTTEITEQGWVKAIHYLSVCPDCLKRYKEDDLILENEYEESLWINHRVEDKLCTHEEQQEWAKKHRNDPWDEWKSNKDI